jgi:hypothetical protein
MPANSITDTTASRFNIFSNSGTNKYPNKRRADDILVDSTNLEVTDVRPHNHSTNDKRANKLINIGAKWPADECANKLTNIGAD